MDQDAFLDTYRGMNARICLFEKSILAGQCRCSRSSKLMVAEREGIQCYSDEAQQQCDDLLKLLRQHGRFALKLSSEMTSLPHGKAMRIQIGGLRGLYQVLYPDHQLPVVIDNIHALVCQARDQFQELGKLPFQEIMKQVAAYQPRRRKPRS